MDLHKFSQGKNNNGYTEYNNNNFSEETTKNASQKAEDIVNKYKDFSENDLTNEIIKSIKEQKKQGVFNKQSIINSINSFSGLIPSDAKQKILDLLDSVDHE